MFLSVPLLSPLTSWLICSYVLCSGLASPPRSPHTGGQQPLRGLQGKQREVSGRGLGRSLVVPSTRPSRSVLVAPLLGCVLKRIFILQNVFKEPALGLNYHFLRAFIFQLVCFGFIEIVSFLCFRSAGRLGLFAFPGGAGGFPRVTPLLCLGGRQQRLLSPSPDPLPACLVSSLISDPTSNNVIISL